MFFNLLGVPHDHRGWPSPASSICSILVGDGKHFHQKKASTKSNQKYSSAGKEKADGMLMVVVKSLECLYAEYPAEGVFPSQV